MLQFPFKLQQSKDYRVNSRMILLLKRKCLLEVGVRVVKKIFRWKSTSQSLKTYI